MTNKTRYINSVAMLAVLNVSQWTARKVDKAQSAKLTDENNANHKLAHVSKKLVKCDELDNINKCVTRAREFHKLMTSPWSESGGTRILSAANFDEYVAGLEREETNFKRLVPLFVRAYPEIRDYAATEHAALGKLFSLKDYPAPERISAKFAWHSEIFAIPDGDDFRCDIGDSAVARIKADIEASVNERVTMATMDIFERVHETVGKLATGLSEFNPDKTGKERGIFRDSLMENVGGLLDVLPGLNFTNDARVNKLLADINGLLANPDVIRADHALRANIVSKAKQMVEDVSMMMA